MSPVLDVFLPTEVFHPIRWRRYPSASARMLAWGDWGNSEAVIKGVKSGPDKEEVRVFIPGEWVIVRHVDLPDGAARQAREVVPVLLEEELCEDIDVLHFAILSVEQRRVTVAVIRHQKMQWLLDWLLETGLFPRTVLPDWMAFTSGQIIVHGNRCLMRSGQWEGWSAELSMVPSILGADNPAYVKHQPFYLSGSSSSQLAESFSYRYGPVQARDYNEVLREIQPAGSLLCGRWRARTDYRRYWVRGRVLVWGAALVMCILPLQKIVTLLTLKAQTETWQAKVDHTVEKWAGEPSSDTVRTRLNAFVQNLHQPHTEGELLVLLPQLAQVLASFKQAVSIVSITFDRHEKGLSIVLEAVGAADMDAVRTALATHFDVEAGGQDENHRVSVVLKVKQKNNGGT